MRGLFAGLLLSLVTAAPAFAEPWAAPDSRLTFNTPAGWTATRAPITTRTYVVAREGERQCHVLTMDRPLTAERLPTDVRDASKQLLEPPVWERIPTSMPRVFGENARFISARVDDTGPWPIQFGRYESADRVVHAAVQFRPGIEFWAFCYTTVTSLSDDGAVYDPLFRSIAATDDAQLDLAIAQHARDEQARARREHEQAMNEHERVAETFNSFVGEMSTGGMGAGGTQ